MAQFKFVMRSGPTVGQTYPLEGEELTIGRDTASNRIAINEGEVSRKHVRLTWKETGHMLEDLGSTNGTFLNGKRLSAPVLLKAGDLVALGENVVLIYESIIDPDATRIASKATKIAPAPTPVAAAPVPATSAAGPIPVYAGQVPAGPLDDLVKPKKKFSVIWIILAVIVLCICLVSVFLFFAPRSFWCGLPFIQWPAGSCP